MVDQLDMFGEGAQEMAPSSKLNSRSLAFGKYKGQPFEVLLSDPQYAVWLLGSKYEDLQHSHPTLFAFLIQRYGAPERTPDHNRLQNRFLDETFCAQFALAASPELQSAQQRLAKVELDIPAIWRTRVQQVLGVGRKTDNPFIERFKEHRKRSQELATAALRKEAEHLGVYNANGCRTHSHIDAPTCIRGLQFECGGADVTYRFELGYRVETQHLADLGFRDPCDLILDYFVASADFRIEVKPVLGDDYPAVLRAMKAANCSQLLVVDFNAAGATWEQVVKAFGLSGITALRLDEVELTAIPSCFGLVPVKHITKTEAESIIEAVMANANSAESG